MKSNMADEKGGDGYLAKLEDLCVRFIRANVNCWKPEDFLGMLFNHTVFVAFNLGRDITRNFAASAVQI